MTETFPGEVQILPDGSTVARRAAEELVRIANDAVKQSGRFTIALAGGSTPKTLYELLASDPKLRSAMPWDKMQVFFGDERHVGPDDTESNYRMAREGLLSKVPLGPEQLSHIKGEYGVSIRKTSGESDLGAAVQCGSRIETAREPTRQSLLLSVPAMVR